MDIAAAKKHLCSIRYDQVKIHEAKLDALEEIVAFGGLKR